MTKIAAFIALAFLGLASQANAQSAPYVYPATVGTSPSQVIPSNLARKRLVFFNPNATALVSVCPAGPRRDTGGSVTCAVNGAGSITLLPYGSAVVGAGVGTSAFPMPSAWNGVASAAASALTIYEFE